jgi:hypothetical protein
MSMKTKSAPRGKSTSPVEVGNISAHGLWLVVEARELFLPFESFPWFRDAPVGKLLNVTLPHPGHLYWPDLDIDLAIESIEHPERYPLVSRSGAGKVRETSRAPRKAPAKKPRRR